MQTVPGLDPLYQGGTVTVFLRIDKINTSLIQRNGVGGRQNPNVVHIRLRGIAVAVAVHG